MRIILDGLDNVGKSTQITKIREYVFKKYGIVLISTHSLFLKIIDYHKFAKNEYIQWFNCNNIIADRLHISERVYGKIYRNYTNEQLDYLYKLEENNQDAILFVLIDNVDDLVKRDDGLSFTIDKVKKQNEIDLFIDAFEKSKLKNKKLININKLNEKKVFEIIKNFIDLKLQHKLEGENEYIKRNTKEN